MPECGKGIPMLQSRQFAVTLDCSWVTCQSLLCVHLAAIFFCSTQICCTWHCSGCPIELWQGMTMPDCAVGALIWSHRYREIPLSGGHRYTDTRVGAEFWPREQILQIWSEAAMQCLVGMCCTMRPTLGMRLAMCCRHQLYSMFASVHWTRYAAWPIFTMGRNFDPRSRFCMCSTMRPACWLHVGCHVLPASAKVASCEQCLP